MKFSISKETFLNSLEKVQGITKKQTNVPITSNVLLSVADKGITIRATDLEVAFRGSYEAKVKKGGSVCVPSRKLFEVVRSLPDKDVLIEETENKWLKIANKRINCNMAGMDTEDFPDFFDVSEVKFHGVGSKMLSGMIDKTVYCALGDEGRQQLSGVYFEEVGKGKSRKLRMVATDGHRLSKIDVSFKKSIGLDKGIIIPKNGILGISKFLFDKESVEIGVKENSFVVSGDGETFIVRLIEGDFPDYDMVIPKKFESRMKVDKEGFLIMLNRMAIFSSDTYCGVTFNISKNSLEAVMTNPELGEIKESIDVEFKGESLEVSFNPGYFFDMIGSMDSGEIEIEFVNSGTPCVISGDGDPGFCGVVMPMRV